MAKDKIQSAQTIQARNRIKYNRSGKKRHYSELVNSVPLQDGNDFHFKTQDNEFKLAEMMLRFVESKFKRDLNKLKFNPLTDNISTLIQKCNQVVKDNKMSFSLPDESMSFEQIEVLYEVPFKEQTWFNFDMCNFSQTPEELRPAFALVCRKISNVIEREDMDYFCYTYANLEESPILDWEYLYEEEGSAELLEETLFNLNIYRDSVAEIKSYLEKDIQISRDFIPRNKKEKALKEILLDGAEKINFESFHYFQCDDAVDYEMDYAHSIMILFNSEGVFEQELFSTCNELGGNGQRLPKGNFTITSDEIKQSSTKKQIKEFEDAQNFFFEINDAYRL